MNKKRTRVKAKGCRVLPFLRASEKVRVPIIFIFLPRFRGRCLFSAFPSAMISAQPTANYLRTKNDDEFFVCFILGEFDAYPPPQKMAPNRISFGFSFFLSLSLSFLSFLLFEDDDK
jgi:hypothetical protein